MEKKYIFNFFASLLVILVLISPISIFLFNAGEFKSISSIANEQLTSNNDVVYGSALRSNDVNYKAYMLSQIKPKIITLGSSRVMKFSKHMFNKSFYNLGGVMSNINQGYSLSDHIIKQNPELILLGVDLWWFNDRWLRVEPMVIYNNFEDYSKVQYLNASNIIDVVQWIISGKIKAINLFNSFASKNKNIGIQGLYSDGFGPDGEHFTTRLITGESPSKDLEFKESIKEVNTGVRYDFESGVNQQHYENFILLVNKFKSAGIKVVIFLPPFSPEISNILSDPIKASFINELKDKFDESNLVYYDFGNPENFNSSSCEFFDGIHPGNITNARLLLEINSNENDINGYIKTSYLKDVIYKFKDFASILNPNLTSLKEIDFLGIECEKIDLNSY